MIHHQDIYRQYCQTENNLPIFMQPWWLDQVCGPNTWGVSISYDAQEKIIGALTYGFFKKWGLTYLANPVLTPYAGPWLKKPQDTNTYTQNTFSNQQTQTLIDQLPNLPIAILKLHPSEVNAFPWTWSGYRPILKHTYHLEMRSNITEEYKDSVHQDINRAKNKLSIQVNPSSEALFDLLVHTFRRQKQDTPFNGELLTKLTSEIIQRNSGTISYAVNAQNKPVAGILVVWDAETAYYLLGAKDDTPDSTGAMSLLLHEQIGNLPSHVRTFDFEGSMIKGVEHFFRSFGGKRMNYLEVQRQSSWIGKLYSLLK